MPSYNGYSSPSPYQLAIGAGQTPTQSQIQQSFSGWGYQPTQQPGALPAGTGTGAGDPQNGFYGTPPQGYTNLPFGNSFSTVPNQSTFMQQMAQYNQSPFMSPEALANQAYVAAQGDPMSGQRINGTNMTWDQMTEQQKNAYNYAFNLGGAGIPKGQSVDQYLQANQGPNLPWNQSYASWNNNGWAPPALSSMPNYVNPAAHAAAPVEPLRTGLGGGAARPAATLRKGLLADNGQSTRFGSTPDVGGGRGLVPKKGGASTGRGGTTPVALSSGLGTRPVDTIRNPRMADTVQTIPGPMKNVSPTSNAPVIPNYQPAFFNEAVKQAYSPLNNAINNLATHNGILSGNPNLSYNSNPSDSMGNPWRVVKTPLGYTEWEQNPQNPMGQQILNMLLQNSFGASGNNDPLMQLLINQTRGGSQATNRVF